MPYAPYSLLASLDTVKDLSHPPIHLWNPTDVKDIDMVIREDGSWFYLGTEITRPRLVRLFSTVLRREADGDYYLVTPAEKCRIQVLDVPFTAILLTVRGEGEAQMLDFTTNVGDVVPVAADRPIRLDLGGESGPLPYVLVRQGLEARIVRSAYYHLTDLVKDGMVEGESWSGVWSRDTFFPLMKSTDAAG